MSFTSLSCALRAGTARSTLSAACSRGLHTSVPLRASILFALGALSNSRETQHFNKLTRLPRTEHSPPLKLIKTSEVDPFPLPTPPPPKLAPRSNAWDLGGSRSALRVWDQKALQIGRVFLTEQARQTHRLQQALGRAKIRSARHNALMKRDKLAWQQEKLKLQKDMRAAGAWILVSIGTATALATWRFWPETGRSRGTEDLGRKIAARAAAAMPLPAAVSSEPAVLALPAPMPPVVPVSQGSVVSTGTTPSAELKHIPSSRSWWQGLFWKQS